MEGDLDAAVIRRMFSTYGYPLTRLDAVGGRSKIYDLVPKLIEASERQQWFVLVDLDDDVCAPELTNEWEVLDTPLIFRVAVREIESWLMADAENFARFLGVSKSRIPLNPELVANPKEEVVQLARRSRLREIREGLVPRAGSGRKRGPLYTPILSAFVTEIWDPEAARTQSNSLDRCLIRLAEEVG